MTMHVFCSNYQLDLLHVSYFSHDAVLGSFAVILYGRKSHPNYNIPEILQKSKENQTGVKGATHQS